MKTLTTVLLIACVAPPALAQPTNVALSWEISTDAGSTWSPDSAIIDTPAPTSVLVRGRMTWLNTDHSYVFSALYLDSFVARSTGSGPGDALTNPLFLQQGALLPRNGAAAIEVGNIIKVDLATDLEPPGLGPGWLLAGQIPQFPEYDDHNPVTVIQYEYLLDATPGVRTISAALRTGTDGSTWFFYNTSAPSVATFATVRDGSITVLPTPAPLALAAFAAGITTARRRKR